MTESHLHHFVLGGLAVWTCIVISIVTPVNSQAEPFVPERRVIIPPEIIAQPEKKIPFVIDESIELPCVATGEPTPNYRWLMNDEDFSPSGNDGRVAVQPGVGTLIFARPLERDEAIYQCIAENVAGIALTVKIDLRRAILEPFPQQSVQEHYVALGGSLELPCTPPTSYPKPDIFWATAEENENFVPVDFDARVSMDPDGNLHIANVRPIDYQGGRRYVCIVQNQVMRRTQHGAYQIIHPTGETPQSHRPSEAYAHPNHQLALRGSTWRVKCIFYGNPTPTVTWERDSLPMPPRKREESFGQELVIENIQYDDSGKYECVGINDGSDVPIRKSFVLSVEAAPYWQERPPQNVDAAEGDSAVFECNALGIPEPTLQWFINGIPISRVAADPRRVLERNRLTYFNLTEDDAMVIQCNATNKHGYIWGNSYLNVLVEAPIILTSPVEGQKSAEGQTIELTCQVFGSPRPLVVWRKGLEQLTGGRYRVLPSGNLEIQEVSLVDAGTYTCTASNKLGTVSAMGSLVVRRRTMIRTPPLDVMVFAGTEAKFTCTAMTDPEEVDNLRIEWKKDGELIDYRFAQRMFKNDMDNSLTISGTYHRDTARYTCVATNGLDSSEASAQLVVQDVPDEPNNVKVQCRDQQRSAEITWQPGKENYAPILNFIVQYNTSFAPDTWIDISTNISQTSRDITIDLSPWGNYTFRVLARNKIGLSPPSEHTRNVCRTDQDLPEKNPENVIGEGDEPNNLVIYWTPMPQIEWNGDGFYYLVRWKEADSDEDPEPVRISFPDAYHYVVPGRVETYKEYIITVKAGNSVGETREPAQEVRGFSGEDTPLVHPTGVQVIQDSISGTEATIEFRAVDTSPERIRGFFRGYRVQFWRSTDGEDAMREEDFILNKPRQYPRPRERRQTDETQQLHLTHLPPYSEITVQVRVLNKYYASEASERIYFITHESVPGPPSDFEVIARGSTHIEMQWQLPREPNGQLVGYNISYQIITGLNLGRIQYRPSISDPDVLRARLTGLRPETDYRVYLAASTRIGRGEHIFLDTRTTSAGPPSPPTFDIIEAGDTFINASWVPSRTGNPGSVFYVQFRPRGEYHWMHSTDEELDYKMSIEGLDPGTTYQVRVVAKNGAGDEAPAEWQEVITGGVAPGGVKLSTAGWFWGIFVALILIILLLILFIFLKRIRDEWWDRKEAEIEEQVRQFQAEEAAQQLEIGIINQYAKTGSREVMDTSHASLSGSEYKEPLSDEIPEDEDDEEDDDEFEDEEDEEFEEKAPSGRGFDAQGVPVGGYRYGQPVQAQPQVAYAQPHRPPQSYMHHPGPAPQHQGYAQAPPSGPYRQPPYNPQFQLDGRSGDEKHDSAMSSFV